MGAIMSVRKRNWFTNLQHRDIDPKAREIAAVKGKPGDWKKYIERAAESLGIEPQEAWIVDYTANGSRHIETFERKKDADAREAEVTVNIDKGIHTATSKSITVAQAAEDWLAYVGGEGRERSTLEQYEQHIRLHILPRIGNEKLARLTTPRMEALRDELLKSM